MHQVRVVFKDGFAETMSADYIEIDDGSLKLLSDTDVVAAYAPGHWERVYFVKPEGEK